MPTPRRVAVTARIRSDLADEVRSFVRDQAGRPLYLSLSEFTEAAFLRHLALLRHQLAHGEADAVGLLPGRNGHDVPDT